MHGRGAYVTGGACMMGVCVPGGMHVHGREACRAGGVAGSMCGMHADTVNERALLECILV